MKNDDVIIMRDEERRRLGCAPAIPTPATAVDGALHVGDLLGRSRRTRSLDRLRACAVAVDEHRLHRMIVVVEAIGAESLDVVREWRSCVVAALLVVQGPIACAAGSMQGQQQKANDVKMGRSAHVAVSTTMTRVEICVERGLLVTRFLDVLVLTSIVSSGASPSYLYYFEGECCSTATADEVGRRRLCYEYRNCHCGINTRWQLRSEELPIRTVGATDIVPVIHVI